MRGILQRAHPSFERVLVIESGPRDITEKFLRHVYDAHGCRQLDLLTCYDTAPESFDAGRGNFICVTNPEIATKRTRTAVAIGRSRYNIVATLCTGSPVLRNWKLLIALLTPAKLVLVNEHGDYFLFDYWHRNAAQSMLLRRLDVAGALRLELVGEIVWFPVTVAYLASYAALLHAKRFFNTRFVLRS
jgi:hypothetical protein